MGEIRDQINNLSLALDNICNVALNPPTELTEKNISMQFENAFPVWNIQYSSFLDSYQQHSNPRVIKYLDDFKNQIKQKLIPVYKHFETQVMDKIQTLPEYNTAILQTYVQALGIAEVLGCEKRITQLHGEVDKVVNGYVTIGKFKN